MNRKLSYEKIPVSCFFFYLELLYKIMKISNRNLKVQQVKDVSIKFSLTSYRIALDSNPLMFYSRGHACCVFITRFSCQLRAFCSAFILKVNCLVFALVWHQNNRAIYSKTKWRLHFLCVNDILNESYIQWRLLHHSIILINSK